MTTHPASPPPGAARDDGAGPIETRPAEPTTEVPDAEELARLRAEVSALEAQLDTRRRRVSTGRRVRGIIAAILIAITAIALVASVVGVWSARTVLNTDRWVATMTPLPKDPQVAAAVADYSTNQLFQALNVEQRLQTVLPPQAAFIAGPIAGQVRDAVEKTVYNVLQSDRFQPVWQELLRRTHQRALAIINGTSDVVVVRQNRVDIDLLPLINQVLRQLSAQLPTLFGKQITLPDITSGAIPDNLRTRVEEQLGITLPANFAQFTVYDSGQLYAVQQAVVTAKRDTVLFVIGTFLLLLAAVAISPRRRRTLLQLGIWLVIVAVAVTAAVRAVRTQVLEQIPAGVYRDGVGAAVTIVFSQLRTRGTQLIWLGVILAVLMYLIGPGRGPTWLRRQIAAGARAAGHGIRVGGRAGVTRGPGFIARYRDPLRIAGIAVAAVLALILSSWTALLVIAMVLAAYEVFVTLVARSAARRAEEAGDAAPTALPSGAGAA
jgi:hypothetical protein